MSKKVLLRNSVWLLAVLLLACVHLAEAQQPKNIPRIGILSPGFSEPTDNLYQLLEAFRQGLRDLGYVEGRNIIIEFRFAEQKPDRLSQLADELVSLKPDVLYTLTTPGVLAAKGATTSIPIVVGAAGNLVERGIVASHARPGGNITGLTLISEELDSKRLELLKEAAPKTSRVAVLVNPANPAWKNVPNDLDVSRALGFRSHRVEARGVDEFEAAFSEMTRNATNALLVVNDSLFTYRRKRVAELAAKYRLPTIAERKDFAEAGGLMAYGTSLPDMHRRAAVFVDKILKGTKPADIPVERPTKFELVINLKTAKQIGLTIPPSVLARADRVIK